MRHAAVRSSRHALTTSLLLAVLIASLSCSDESAIGPGGVAAVRVTPDTLHVLLGKVDTAQAFPLDADLAYLPNKSVTWATTDPTIASVNETGEVTGNVVGTTQISATVSGIIGTATVVVDPSPTFIFQPDSARLNGIAGSPTPATGSDSILNGGGGSLTGLSVDSITYPVGATGWLGAALTATTVPTSIDLTADAATPGLGRHVALVWIHSPDAVPLSSALPVVLTLGPDVASSIALQAGNGQTATVNAAVAVAPAVQVRDQFNNPVPGVSVTFAPAAGSGSVVGGAATTDASGIAAVTSWTLGTVAGGQTLTATSGTLNGSPVTFTATGTAAGAAQLSINGGNNQAAIAGTPVATPPSALVTDNFGNPVSGVTVTFAVTGGGGQITGTTPVSNASGVAALGTWTLGPTAGANSLSATSGTLNGSPLTFTATGNPGNATDIALVSGNNQTGTVGTVLGAAYVVHVTDINSNPVQGVTVGWSAIGGSMNPASSITDANGDAISTRTLGGTAGAQAAAATVAGLNGSPVNFTATATPGTVTQILVNTGNGQSATVNTAVATAPSVVARDGFSNAVPGAAITFTVTAGGGSVNCGAGAVGACNVTTNGIGIATVTNWTLGTGAGTNNNTLSATRAGATGTSFTATATAGAVAFVSINTGNGQSTRPGTAVATDPSVLVRDAFLNPVPGATVTYSIASGNGSVTCVLFGTTSCSVTSNASGIATVVAWTMGSAGLPTVAAPANGRYTNTMDATSNAVTATFTGFGAWSYATDVQTIFSSATTGRCLGCHFTGGQAPNLTAGLSYAALRGIVGACGTYVPIGFNTAGSSVLLDKISASFSCGSRMPADGGAFLGATEINIIRDWINNNSPNN